MQEEIRRSTKDGSSSKEDEENCALASKEKKGKEKDSHPKSGYSYGGKKFDKSKVRCFHCHEVGQDLIMRSKTIIKVLQTHVHGYAYVAVQWIDKIAKYIDNEAVKEHNRQHVIDIFVPRSMEHEMSIIKGIQSP